MANKYVKTGYDVECSNPECNNLIYVKKGTYEKSDYKLFTCCRKCQFHPEVVKLRADITENMKGYRNPFLLEKVKEKIKKTNMEKYGVDHPMKNKDIQNKAHLTRINKYGKENLQGIAPINKLEETCLRKFGAKQFFSSDMGKMTRENLRDNYGYSDSEIDNIFKSKSITLNSMIDRWGEKEGKRKYDKWLEETRQSKSNFIKRWGQVKGLTLWKEHVIKCYNNDNVSSVSSISMELFDVLNEYIEKIGGYCIYGKREWFINDKEEDNVYFYDFKYRHKMIEFNGDYWHGNPLLYNENDFIKMPGGINVLVKEKWDKDNKKVNIAKRNGFEVKVVWENDFRNNKYKIIKDCLQFLGIGNSVTKQKESETDDTSAA